MQNGRKGGEGNDECVADIYDPPQKCAETARRLKNGGEKERGLQAEGDQR